MLSVDVIIVISVIGAMIGCWGCCRIVETAPRTIAACKDCCFIVIDPCVDIFNKISKMKVESKNESRMQKNIFQIKF